MATSYQHHQYYRPYPISFLMMLTFIHDPYLKPN